MSARWVIHKRCWHGWTGLNANDNHTSNKLSRKWCKDKEVNNDQAAKIYEVHLMQRTITEVHKRLCHHHARLTNSREVLMECLSYLREQPKGREQCQARDAGKDNKVSVSLGRAKREPDSVRQFIGQTDKGTTHASSSARL